MPIIDGVKFSCNPCIKGHRSAHCSDLHTDRPLVEIRKKGRPRKAPVSTTGAVKSRSSATPYARPASIESNHRPSLPSHILPSTSTNSFASSSSPSFLRDPTSDDYVDSPQMQLSLSSSASSVYELDTSIPAQQQRSTDPLYSGFFFLPPTNVQDESTLCFCGPNCVCGGCHVHDALGSKLRISGIRCAASTCKSFGLCSSALPLPSLPLGVSTITDLMSVIAESQEPLQRAPYSNLDGVLDESTELGNGPQKQQTLSSIFFSHLPTWPSTSDLLDRGSRAGSIYSSVSSHEEGIEFGDEDRPRSLLLLDQSLGDSIGGVDGGVGVGTDDIARWRSDLELEADFQELLVAPPPLPLAFDLVDPLVSGYSSNSEGYYSSYPDGDLVPNDGGLGACGGSDSYSTSLAMFDDLALASASLYQIPGRGMQLGIDVGDEGDGDDEIGDGEDGDGTTNRSGVPLERFGTERPPSSGQRTPDPALAMERVKTERPPSLFNHPKAFFRKITSKSDIVKQ